MNLAQSLLAACERHPELEAFPGITYGELLPARPRGSPAGSASSPASASPSCSTTGSRPRSSTGRRSGRVRSSSRSRGGSRRRSSTTASTTAARASSIRDGDALPGRRRSTPARSTATSARSRSSSTRRARPGRPKGVPRSHARRPRRRAGRRRSSTATGFGDRTLGVMPLYHTMGIHSLARDAPRRRVLRAAAALGRGRGAAADRERADHVALPRADALPRPRPPRPSSAARDVSSRPRARLRGRGDDVDARPPLRRGVRARRVRQPLRVDRDLHVLDRARPAGEARLRGAAGGQHAAAARPRRRDLRRTSTRDEAFARLLEPARRRREGDPRRLVPHGRHRASRRGRRPVDRRPRRRHDRLGRREHASARGRGRPRGAPGRASRSP